MSRFDEMGSIHPIVDEGRADDGDAHDIGFLPSDLFFQIPPGIFVQGTIHVVDIELFPF
jgi:hypothetical protein